MLTDENGTQGTPAAPPTARDALVARVEAWLEGPMLVLGLAWLALLIVDLARGLSPFLDALGSVIWLIFVAEFALRLAVAPRRLLFLRRNVIAAVSLALPALRVLRVARFVRVLRATRAVRGVRLARVLTTINRSMRTLGTTMHRRGLKYVVSATAIVAVAGAAGMYAFEHDVVGTGIDDVGSAIWWTAMVLTTMGSDYWPRSGEGRILCLLLSTYAFAVFGYITAALASYFVGRDAEAGDASVARHAAIDDLRAEIEALRQDLRDALAARAGASDANRGG